MVINTIILRLLFPLGAVGAGILAEHHQWGVLNNISTQSLFIKSILIILSILWLDLCIYIQHILFHKVPILWKLHRVHHADQDLDVTSGTRFHTLEMILSMIYKTIIIMICGISPLAVLLFEIILNGMALFNHSNLYILPKLEKCLRYFIVTPDMHRIHHSIHPKEAHSNFGFNLSWWDYIFSSYTAKSKENQNTMTLGDPHATQHTKQSLFWLLIYPFK